MQQVILEVKWHKGFFGESGISWDITVSARILISYKSLSQPVCSGLAEISPKVGGKITKDLLHVY